MMDVVAHFVDRPARLFGSLLLLAVFLTMVAEFVYSRLARLGLYERSDTFTNLKMYAGFFIVHFLFIPGLTIALYDELSRFAVWDIGRLWWLFLGNVHWSDWLILAVLDDFIFYWYHRLCHTRRLFWASHEGHHSSREFNLSIGVRQAWTPFFPILFWAPLVIIGFEPSMIVFVSAVNLTLQIFLHTRVVRSFGPLDWIFNSPSHHRVHHASNPEYVDKNFGGLLIVWDRLFGTFAKEKAAPVYGIGDGRLHHDVIENCFSQWRQIFRDLGRARSGRAVVGALFGPPKWSSGEG